METGQVALPVVTATEYTYYAKDATNIVSQFLKDKKTGTIELHISQGTIGIITVKERHKGLPADG
jgi:hypothetical protein